MGKFIENGIGENCPKCSKPMTHRKRIKPPKDGKTYFFTEYDFCKPCRFMQHYEKYKSQDWQENERQQDFFSNLRNESI